MALREEVQPTCEGFIPDHQTAFTIIEQVHAENLPAITSRLTEEECRRLIRHGAIFVFDINDIGRWTDARKWTPSRGLDKFMLYREVDKTPRQVTAPLRNSSTENRHWGELDTKESSILGPLGDNSTFKYNFKPNGLMKKTLVSRRNSGRKYRLVAYYSSNVEVAQALKVPELVTTIEQDNNDILRLYEDMNARPPPEADSDARFLYEGEF